MSKPHKATGKAWKAYSKRQRAQRELAFREMREFVLDAVADGVGIRAIQAQAVRIAMRNGAASAALACEWYEAVAKAAGVAVERAAPVVVANPGRIAVLVEKAAPLVDVGDVEGFATACGSAVASEVKRSASATMGANARRDGAEFAWIPQGDETCAFCITLASNGWVRAKKSTAMGDHEEHIHPNCDCEFAIRFGDEGGVEGYNPKEFSEKYSNAEGGTSKEKINSIRRDLYAKNKETIKAQHRERYAALHQKDE